MTRIVSLVRCPYCENFMDEDGRWSFCNPCGYHYVYGETDGAHHKFEATLGDWACALNIYPDADKTVLDAFNSTYGLDSDEVNHDHGHTYIKIPYAMTEITPQNVIDKIKLILMFS